MEEYIVSARKYRPASFDTVVGQRALTTTLLNAIRTNKLAHAYLFCGPRGVGKTTCARIFAKAINCTHPDTNGEACNECESCRSFDEGRSMNIHELDAASNNSVDDIREVIQQVQIPPQTGRYKVFIIDEVHMLSSSAFNAFLKTLEEPPSYAIFVLATTEKHKILPTILSRCQIYDFARMTISNTVDHLRYVAQKEGYTIDDESLNLIAQKADGGMRDALSIFDQIISFTGGNVTYQQTLANLNVLDSEYYFRLVDHFLKHEVEPCMLLLNEVILKGFDPGVFIGGLASHMRDLMVSRDPQTLPLLEVSESLCQRYQEQAQRCQPKFLYRTIKLCNDCDQNYRTSHNKRLQVEICLIQAAQEDDASSGRCPNTLAPLFNALKAKPSEQQTVVSANTKQATTPSSANSANNASVNGVNRGSDNVGQNPASVATNSSAPSTSPVKTTNSRPILKTFTPDILGPSLLKVNQKQTVNETPNVDPSLGHVDESKPPIPLEDHDLSFCWRKFAKSLPVEQKAMSQRMLDINLEILDDSNFTFTVNNEMVKESFNELLPPFLASVRTTFNNNNIKYKIEVAKVETTRIYYSKPDIFKRMIEHNKLVEELSKNLKLEIE